MKLKGAFCKFSNQYKQQQKLVHRTAKIETGIYIEGWSN